MATAVTRWGILGAGNICNDFVLAMRACPNSDVTCVASRSVKRTQEFAVKLQIPISHASYSALLGSQDCDIVYVGTIHPTHFELVQEALNCGKHVLCEKPMTMRAEDTAACIELARERGLFLMEGMWTRCFPAVREARRLLSELGTAVSVLSDFGFRAHPQEDFSRLYNPKLGGGATFDIGVYPLAVVPMVFGARGGLLVDSKVFPRFLDEMLTNCDSGGGRRAPVRYRC
jgi:dihydrodiol dehydrogenase / D-xylose 1-dehydrogenase (NADP)